MFELKPFLPLVFSVLGITILFMTFRLKLEHDSRIKRKSSEDYFERELTASFARKKDLEETLFIKVDFDKIPIPSDIECKKLYVELLLYSSQKLVYLKTYTNLQLKETYGMSHFENLANYEKNYLTFMDILVKYGSILYEKDFMQEAQTTLELALQYQCDVSKCYIVLSDIYLASHDSKGLGKLLDAACNNMTGSYYLDKVLHKIESAKQAID